MNRKQINENKMTRIFVTMMLMLAVFTAANAQDKVIDQIVAVVGGNVILKSDIEKHEH